MKKLLTVLIVFVLIVGGLYGAASIVLGSGKSVDVAINDKDYTSALGKTKVNAPDIKAINLINIGNKAYQTKGTVNIAASFTNAEMSSLVDKANQNGGPIKDFKVKFLGNNEGEISFKLTSAAVDYIKNSNILQATSSVNLFLADSGYNYGAVNITPFVVNYLSGIVDNKPIYAKGKLERTPQGSLSVNIYSISLGQVSLPADVTKKVESATTDFVNSFISKQNGFSIDELRIEDGKLYYKGTLPEEITGTKIN